MTHTAIDWKATQKKLFANPDGDPGRETFGKLFAYSVQRAYVDPVFNILGDAGRRYFKPMGLLTVERLSGVLAEMGHECAGYTRFEENLSYSAQGLADTWPSRYAVNPKARPRVPNAKAKKLERRPQDIANDTYALRMGNEAAADDNDRHPDGWQYRGRSPGMVTGKGAYATLGKRMGLDLVRFPELLADPGIGLYATLLFMEDKKMFDFMDKGDDAGERKAWNGGLIGFNAVQRIRERVKGVLVPA